MTGDSQLNKFMQACGRDADGVANQMDQDDFRQQAMENPPWLVSTKPKLHHEQAITYFFSHARAASSKGQPLRFHMATGRIYVYASII